MDALHYIYLIIYLDPSHYLASLVRIPHENSSFDGFQSIIKWLQTYFTSQWTAKNWSFILFLSFWELHSAVFITTWQLSTNFSPLLNIPQCNCTSLPLIIPKPETIRPLEPPQSYPNKILNYVSDALGRIQDQKPIKITYHTKRVSAREMLTRSSGWKQGWMMPFMSR